MTCRRSLAGLVSLALLAGCAAGGGGGGRPRFAIDLAAIEPAPEAYEDADLAHLQYVLTWEQGDEYLAMPVAERAEWMRVIWGGLDPTPTTARNERKEEHYRRLAYVRREFVIEERPGWDRRGELLLRYGSPEVRRFRPGDVVEGLGLVPPAELWIYQWLGQAYQLEDTKLQNNFQDAFVRRAGSRENLSSDINTLTGAPDDPRGSRAAARSGAATMDGDGFATPTRSCSRSDLTSNIDHLMVSLNEQRGFARESIDVPDAEEQMQAKRLERLLSQGQLAVAETPQAYLHDYGGAPLEYVFDVLNFAGGAGGRTRLEVNTAIWARDLEYRAEGNELRAGMDVEALAKTLDYREVNGARGVAGDRRAPDEERDDVLVLDRISLDLDPGEYRLALSVRDTLSGNLGIYETEVAVREFRPDRLGLSDIQLAADVARTEPGDPFGKGDFRVVPYPLGTYTSDQDVFLYFEVYGLTISPTGDAFYTVEFTVRPREVGYSSWFGSSRGRIVPGVGTRYDGSTRGPTAREFIALDPVTFDSGMYDVEVQVTDVVTEATVGGVVAFGIDRD